MCVAKGQEDMTPPAWLSGRLRRREGEWESEGQGFVFQDNRLQPRAQDLVSVSVLAWSRTSGILVHTAARSLS